MSGQLEYTPLDQVPKIYARLKATYDSGITKNLQWRRQQLYQLGKLLQDNEDRLVKAINIDVGKPRLEAVVADVGPVVYAVAEALKNLDDWVKPEKPSNLPEWRSGWDTTVYRAPKGIVLIISPWNYPYVITLGPLVGAIAAGNTAIIKPSEYCPTVSQALADLLPQYLDTNAFACVNGDQYVAQALLEHRFAHIFFTGSNRVGRLVAAAAAKHVTPLTLELGGKCPTVIAEDADIDLSVKRILYGKQNNLGQICVSPDYCLVPKSKMDAVVAAFHKWHKTFFPEGTLKSPDIGHVISEVHHDRLSNLIKSTRGKVIIGGKTAAGKKMELTIVKDVPLDDILMQDEVYGPILSLVPVEDTDHAIRIIAERPTPLVIYLFTSNEGIRDKFLEKTASGTLVLNDTYQQLVVHEMPFGGSGESGYGSYLGKSSFDTFTQLRSYVHVPLAADPHLAFRYPPYSDEAVNALSTFGMRIPLPKP